MPLSEHVYWVTVTFKITEYSNKSSSNFALSLNIPPWELFTWFRRPQLGATGDWQLHRDNAPTTCITSYAVFLWNIKSPRWLSPSKPRFGALWHLAFPKTKITFEREEISDCWWDSGKYVPKLTAIGQTVWGPKVPTLKGTEASLSYIQCFLNLVSSSIHVSIFHITWLYFLDRTHVS